MNSVLMKEYIEKIEKCLDDFIPENHSAVCEAMRYSISAGGKRIRPVLTLEFCRICGCDYEKALPFACAVEMIHTYSLIHDDLPCMDDDDMRRGRPSCHKQFGEDIALLAGDALLTYAFPVIMSAEFDSDKKVKAAAYLAEKSGFDGMIGGQLMDLQNENSDGVNENDLSNTDKLKTGALIKAACVLGCIAAGADEKQISAAEEYAENIGLAFQIVDDILDVTADEEQLGKPVGSDKEQGKNTYVTFYGIEQAKNLAAQLSTKAKEALDIFGNEADGLKNFADSLLGRNF